MINVYAVLVALGFLGLWLVGMTKWLKVNYGYNKGIVIDAGLMALGICIGTVVFPFSVYFAAIASLVITGYTLAVMWMVTKRNKY